MPVTLEDIARKLLETHPVRKPQYALTAHVLACNRPCACPHRCVHKWKRMMCIARTWDPAAVRQVTREMVARERARRHWDLVRAMPR